MKIEEFKDGYCITHKDKDYLFRGKSNNTVVEVSKKVQKLLLKDMEELKRQVLSDNFLG